MPCTNEHVEPIMKDDHNGEQQQIVHTCVIPADDKDYHEPPPDVTGEAPLSLNKINFVLVLLIFIYLLFFLRRFGSSRRPKQTIR